MGWSRENVTYLPGFRLPDNIELTDDFERAVSQSGIVLIVVGLLVGPGGVSIFG